jgi:hypothetical protein
MQKALLKENEERWCEIEIMLNDGRLSITGSEGSIIFSEDAKEQAILFWESVFEEDRESAVRIVREHGPDLIEPKNLERIAAETVVQVDGEYHGLDVHKQDGDRIFLMESCGQITDQLKRWFPELADLLPWHLNYMKPGCQHQESFGWGRGTQIQVQWEWLVDGSKYTANEVYHDSINAPCPECGYRFGSSWLKRELPVWVTEKVHDL